MTERSAIEQQLPKTLEELFTGFQPKGKKREAIQMLGVAWDQMTAAERQSFFPGITEENISQPWANLDTIDKMPIYQQSFVRVFGDHKMPFEG